MDPIADGDKQRSIELARTLVGQSAAMRRVRATHGLGIGLSQPALDRLCDHDWPGNVREARRASAPVRLKDAATGGVVELAARGAGPAQDEDGAALAGAAS